VPPALVGANSGKVGHAINSRAADWTAKPCRMNNKAKGAVAGSSRCQYLLWLSDCPPAALRTSFSTASGTAGLSCSRGWAQQRRAQVDARHCTLLFHSSAFPPGGGPSSVQAPVKPKLDTRHPQYHAPAQPSPPAHLHCLLGRFEHAVLGILGAAHHPPLLLAVGHLGQDGAGVQCWWCFRHSHCWTHQAAKSLCMPSGNGAIQWH